MAERRHRYRVRVEWAGETTGYTAYSRDHLVCAAGRPDIPGSSDRAFRGSADRWNPELLLLASLSSCHKLWFLHLCAQAGVVVTRYDDASGEMIEDSTGTGHFTGVTLRPKVVVKSGDAGRLALLHESAHRMCFIANSVNFPVEVEPQ